MQQLIGIDLGGTKIEIAVINPSLGIVYKDRTPTPQKSYSDILNALHSLINKTISHQKLPHPKAIGIGMPGCLDPVTQLVRGSNTLVLNCQPLSKDLEQLLQCKVHLQNDANCLAVSEAVDGAAQDLQVVFAAIIGTGCGGGFAINRKAWGGKNAIAGEWGHNPLPWPSVDEINVEPCWCGQVSCQETWISGTGFANDHLRITAQTLKAEQIIDNMRAGDANAQLSFKRYVNRLARALASVMNVLDPDCIVLGGGMSNVDEIYELLPNELVRYTFTKPIATPVVKALHGDSSGVRGAAWLVGANKA
ncbi:MAG: ROK family protein [Betaproteobacteria bacterium]